MQLFVIATLVELATKASQLMTVLLDKTDQRERRVLTKAADEVDVVETVISTATVEPLGGKSST